MEALTLPGTIIVDGEIVMVALEGLGSEYDIFFTSFTTNPHPVTFQELQGMYDRSSTFSDHWPAIDERRCCGNSSHSGRPFI